MNWLAALYNPSSGSMTNIGALGGSHAQVNALSDTGLAVGLADTPTTSHAFLYDDNTGVLTDLGNPVSSSFYSNALGVNDLGQVVGGYQMDAAWDMAGFIYTQAGGIQNLNNLVNPAAAWKLGGASGINDAGCIVGAGFNPQGQYHAYLLTPVVPEPSTVALLFGAIVGFAAIRGGARLLARHRDHRL